mmetsp:Transcript_620/g.1869  ORF Transcript_620/g.1869 Transcript_620/m.1869 type:complete len:602 (+) Transcript_620:2209-4014(+)
MRIETARVCHGRMEEMRAEAHKTRSTERQTGIDQLDVTTRQCVVDHGLVLLDTERTGAVDEHSAVVLLTAARSEQVDGREEQLLLEMSQLADVVLAALRLDRRIACDHTQAGTGCIEQYAIKVVDQLTELATVIVAHHTVAHTETMHVRDETSETFLLGIVREQLSGVAHARCDVCRLTTGSRAHVEHALVRARIHCHHWKPTGSSLQHVVAGKVLGCATQRHLILEHLQAVVAPLHRIEVDTARDQRLRKILATALQRVGAQSDWSRALVRLEELECLAHREQTEKELRQKGRIAVVVAYIDGELFGVVRARTSGLAQFTETREDAHDLVHSSTHSIQVGSLGLQSSRQVEDVDLLFVAVFLTPHLFSEIGGALSLVTTLTFFHASCLLLNGQLVVITVGVTALKPRSIWQAIYIEFVIHIFIDIIIVTIVVAIKKFSLGLCLDSNLVVLRGGVRARLVRLIRVAFPLTKFPVVLLKKLLSRTRRALLHVGRLATTQYSSGRFLGHRTARGAVCAYRCLAFLAGGRLLVRSSGAALRLSCLSHCWFACTGTCLFGRSTGARSLLLLRKGWHGVVKRRGETLTQKRREDWKIESSSRAHKQ